MGAGQSDDVVKLRLLGTSDLHAYIDDFDYYRNEETKKYGLVNLVGEIHRHRAAVKNTFLADTGDLLVGNPLGDFLAAATSNKPLSGPAKQSAPVVCALNKLKFDVAVPGNHDFDYGLKFLADNYNKGRFPFVVSNVYKKGTTEPYFKPYLIFPKRTESESGVVRTLNVGFIGIVPVQTMDLNKKWLESKVEFADPLTSAKKWAKEAKANGADIVIALAHSGIDDKPYSEGMENASWHLTALPEIDALLFGHTHKPFPHKRYAKLKNVDLGKGTINGKPAAQPGKWADHLGVVDMTLTYNNGWKVKSGTGYVVNNKNTPDTPQQIAEIKECTADYHTKVVAKFDEVVGSLANDLRNDFNLLGNDSVYQIVSDSQMAYAKKHIKTSLPILSSVAPAIHRNDPAFYLNIAKGDINERDVGALVYSSTLAAKEITGAELKDWLEISASMFAEPGGKEAPIIKPNHLTFLYYLVNGVKYQIDLSKPSIFNSFGAKIADGEGRVKNITYMGKAVKPADRFVIIASSYNPFFAKEMKAGSKFIDIASPNSRDVLREYLSQSSTPIKTSVIQNVEILLEKGKKYTFSAKNDIKTLPRFKQQTALNIVADPAKTAKGNVYFIQ